MKALIMKTWDGDIDWCDSNQYDVRSNYVECEVLAYDRNKYVLCRFPDGSEEGYKSGYLRTFKDFKYFTRRRLYSLPVIHYDEIEYIGKMPSKRDVQKELKERYKIKTIFTLFVSTGEEGAETKTIKTGTLKQAIRIFRKYHTAHLVVNSGRWNTDGIAEREGAVGIGTLYYDTDRKGRPTYSCSALLKLDAK